jgi:hypothetical protein
MGRLIADVLATSWRPSCPPIEISSEALELVMPSLLESGAAALAWKRVAESKLRTSSAALQLKQAYRLHSLQSAIHERDLKRILSVLRAARVEPILVKGWAIARLYSEAGPRPYGDFDLCVHPKQFPQAKASLHKEADFEGLVDLHAGFAKLDDRSWDELNRRSQLARLGDLNVRVLSAEDHLRVLCFHFLREGAWRPLWLCDIAVAVESRPVSFDWDLFLGENSKRRAWFACTIALAHRLLDANLDGVPTAIADKRLPPWLVPAVLKAWEVRSMLHRHQSPMRYVLRNPSYQLKAKNLRAHWPNAIEGTIGVNGPFNELPRLPFQLGNCALRTMAFLRQMLIKRRDNHAVEIK